MASNDIVPKIEQSDIEDDNRLKTSKPNLISAKSGKSESEIEDENVKPVSLVKLFSFADRYDILLMLLGFLASCAMGTVFPLFSILLGDVFNDFGQLAPANSSNFYQDQAASTSTMFGILSAATFFLGFFQIGCFTLAAERQTLRIREKYLNAVLSQEIGWFDERKSGTLSSQVSENTVIIREALSEKLATLIQFLFTFVASIAIAFFSNWELALVLCASLPLLAIGGFFMARALSELSGTGLSSYTKAGSIVEETLSNIRTVTAFNAQKKILKSYDAHLEDAEKAGKKRGLRVGFGMGFVMFVMFCSYSLGFYYGAVLIKRDRNDALEDFPIVDPECSILAADLELTDADFCVNGELFAESLFSDANCECGCGHPDADCLDGGVVTLVFFSIIIGGFSLGQAAPSLSALQSGRASAAKIFKIIQRKPKISVGDEDDDDKPMPKLSGKISVSKVEFSYPSRKDVKVFDNLNLTIDAGQTTAFVGGSGCGKSTVMQLIQRFYDPDAGDICVQAENGQEMNLKDINLSRFRNEIGLVSQEPLLFATTIAKNIAYGARLGETVSEEHIIEAAKAANAYDFIMEFPDKFDTLVGGKGTQLSGGQRQRIAIARAVLRNPTFLLLDEATSALDNESERVVQRALDELLKQRSRTTIVIAHRLSTIRNADKIFVLGDGGVIEEGTHKQLMSFKKGTYNMLVSAANRTQESNDVQQGGVIQQSLVINDAIGENFRDGDKRAARLLSTASGKADVITTEVMNPNDELKLADVVGEGKSESEDNKKKKEKLYSVPITRIFQLTKPETCWFFPAILGSAMNGAQMPLFALFFADIITVLFESDSDELLDGASRFSVYFILLGFLGLISNLMQNYCFAHIAEKLTRRVRLLLFSSILRQDIAFFDEKENSVGALSSELSTNAALVKAVIADRLGLGVMNITTAVSGLTIAFVNGWQLTLVMFGLLPIIIIGGAAQMAAMASATDADSKYMGPASQVLQESIAGIRTVTAFNARGRVVELFSEFLAEPKKQARKKGLIVGVGFGFSQAMTFSMYAIAFYVGAIFIDQGIFDFNQMLTVFFAVLMTGVGLGQAAGLAPDVAKGSVAVSAVYKIVDRKSKIDPESDLGKKDFGKTEFGFVFDDIAFRYPSRPDVKIFSHLNLKINPGSTVALVGTSGSGKSSIVSLLQRFYDPEEGSIALSDGETLKNLNLKKWRDQIGLVEQEPKLFACSIKENVQYGMKDGELATDEMIVEAAKAANAHDFISAFPEGYDTQVGDQAAQLSGGQKQRICIMRAILRRPRVLLLDEATSALDNKSEVVVQEALDNLLKEQSMTTVVVAHRLTTIKNADVIVVMGHGKVIESGTHNELITARGQYFKLWNAQLSQGA